ncbi:hypothetical protein [Streptomyces venezuelae]|uniref:hypothetical protein n=1 Tax=Streptomyces venezuelae TaxID=54571 RepID=UPI00278C1ABD|nr:hypothetical protein [Streptomyces venezuelae]
MNVRYGRNAHRAGAVVAATCMAVLLAGCGGEEKPQATDKPSATKTSTPQNTPGSQPSAATEEPAEPLVVLKGQSGMEMAINSAVRDGGGFLTVKGVLKNTSDTGRPVPDMRGVETEVLKHGKSLGGATLVDALGKKRYYVLRDTDGRPLTTTGLGIIAAGDSIDVFMQFPAPPASVTDVSFQLPTFEPATLKLS